MKKAFKMACLAYEPSKVMFHNQLISRFELIKHRGFILKKIKLIQTIKQNETTDDTISGSRSASNLKEMTPSKERNYRELNHKVDVKLIKKSVD
jgi:hypothetical protein